MWQFGDPWICSPGVVHGRVLWIWGQIVHFMVCVPVCVSACTSVTDLHPESGSAVCLASIRGSVFLNASVKGELTCSGIFPPAYYFKRHLSWNSPSARCACLHACVCTHTEVNHSNSKCFTFPFFSRLPLCLLLVFLSSSLSRTMVWPQPFPLASALPSNTQHIVSIEHAFNGREDI